MNRDRLRESLRYRLGWIVDKLFWSNVRRVTKRNDRFVLFAHTRSGSYHLVSLLDSHPEIDCYGEFLQPVEPAFKKHIALIGEMDPKWHDPAYRRDNYEEFLKAFYEKAKSMSGYRIPGYKLIAGQHNPAMVYSIMEPGIKVIYLYRNNILAVYSSEQIARSTGQDRAEKGTEIKQAKAFFDPDEFEKRRRTRIDRHNLYLELLRRSRKEFVALEYNEMSNAEVQRKLLAFLGVSVDEALHSSYAKRNSSDVISRFSNPDDVIRHLEKIGHPEWATEHGPN